MFAGREHLQTDLVGYFGELDGFSQALLEGAGPADHRVGQRRGTALDAGAADRGRTRRHRMKDLQE